MEKCYVALGGNIGDTLSYFQKALTHLANSSQICNLKLSTIYETTPVSPIPQRNYLNAVCSFDTTLDPFQLLTLLQTIEKECGKIPKPKESPRTLDLDLLFYGTKILQTPLLTLPHPEWNHRLFVLKPLSDLVDILPFSPPIYLKELLSTFCDLYIIHHFR